MAKYGVHFSLEMQLNGSACAIKEDIKTKYTAHSFLINED